MWFVGIFFLLVSACSLFFAGNSFEQTIAGPSMSIGFLLMISFLMSVIALMFLDGSGQTRGVSKGVKLGEKSSKGKPLGPTDLKIGHHYQTLSAVQIPLKEGSEDEKRVWLCPLLHIETGEIRTYKLSITPPTLFAPTLQKDKMFQYTAVSLEGTLVRVDEPT